MNEAGVFGRFVPDFGRVVAQMQFDMYHHYTVDEHTIRAIGLLARIEKRRTQGGSSAVARRSCSRSCRAACSMSRCCSTTSPRAAAATIRCWARKSPSGSARASASTAAETETVAWLVRYHLLMSATAFKRDLSDFKTILDFAETVQSPERLRLLLAADRRRYPRGRPRRVEQLEAPAAVRSLRSRRGSAAPRPQAAAAAASASPPSRTIAAAQRSAGTRRASPRS